MAYSNGEKGSHNFCYCAWDSCNSVNLLNYIGKLILKSKIIFQMLYQEDIHLSSRYLLIDIFCSYDKKSFLIACRPKSSETERRKSVSAAFQPKTFEKCLASSFL